MKHTNIKECSNQENDVEQDIEKVEIVENQNDEDYLEKQEDEQ